MRHFGTVMLLLIQHSLARGADFCAVKVRVENRFGPAAALVELRDTNERTVQRKIAMNGEAQFCDFGFGKHSISVGGTTCAAMIIPNVQLIFGKEQVYRVYMNACVAGEDLLPRHCRLYFRVSDENGQLPGVEIRVGASLQATTDRYGRALVLINVGERKEILMQKPAYINVSRTVSCPSPVYSELGVQMEQTPVH